MKGVNLGGAFRLLLTPLGRYKNKDEPMLHGMQRERTIWIDPRTPDPLGTLVHELYHMQYPSMTEDEVMDAEEEWMKRATWRQRAQALMLFARAKVASKDEMP